MTRDSTKKKSEKYIQDRKEQRNSSFFAHDDTENINRDGAEIRISITH